MAAPHFPAPRFPARPTSRAKSDAAAASRLLPCFEYRILCVHYVIPRARSKRSSSPPDFPRRYTSADVESAFPGVPGLRLRDPLGEPAFPFPPRGRGFPDGRA